MGIWLQMLRPSGQIDISSVRVDVRLLEQLIVSEGEAEY